MMSLEEAIASGAVDENGVLLSITPLIAEEDTVIVPYGVKEICLSAGKSKQGIETVILPDTVSIVSEGSGLGFNSWLNSITTIAVYEKDDNPADITYEVGLANLCNVRHLCGFPLFNKVEKYLLSNAAHINRSYIPDRKSKYTIELIDDGGNLTLTDGFLCADQGKTLICYQRREEDSEVVEVPYGVERIPSHALVVYTNKVVLPETVRVIEPYGIDDNNVPHTLKEIELRGLPAICADMAKSIWCAITVPGGLRFSEELVKADNGVNGIIIPEDCKVIGPRAFIGHGRLKGPSVFVPNTVEVIMDDAFMGFVGLAVRSISLPASMNDVYESLVGKNGSKPIAGSVLILRGEEGVARIFYEPDTSVFCKESWRRDIDERFVAKNGGTRAFPERIRVALVRLACVGKQENEPSAEMQEIYRTYIKKNAKKARATFIDDEDLVCYNLMEELGFTNEKAKRSSSEKPAKILAKTPTQLADEALRRIKSGDKAALEDVSFVASKIIPKTANTLLAYAATFADKSMVEQLFDMFGAFEMPSVALSNAIAHGKDSVARALLAHGVTLSASMIPVPQKKDTPEKQQRREEWYLKNIRISFPPGRNGFLGTSDPGYLYLYALSDESDALLMKYAQEGLLCEQDMKGLLLASLAESSKYYLPKLHVDLARQLINIGGDNTQSVTLRVMRPNVGSRRGEEVSISEVEDLLYPQCSLELTQVFCELFPQRVSTAWDDSFLKASPDVVKTLVPYLRPGAVEDKAALGQLLSKTKFDEELAIVRSWGN